MPWLMIGRMTNTDSIDKSGIQTLTQLEYFESEYQKLKEMTSLLELTLWKATLDKEMGESSKKLKMGSDFRLQCCTSCGAESVIENVWRIFFLVILCIHMMYMATTMIMRTQENIFF